ncbi:MAG: hypothetical protein ACI8ZO_000088 [Flavobacteriales bacterium]|jgi:hypothetical protein
MIHIGEKIKERVDEVGMSRTVFAKRINKTRNVVYDIFKRQSIDTNQLVLVSKILNFDFFVYYREMLADLNTTKSEKNDISRDIEEVYHIENIQIQLEQLKENNALLKQLNGVLQEKIDNKK